MFTTLYHVNILIRISKMLPGQATRSIVEQVGKMPGYFMSRNQFEMLAAFTALGYRDSKWIVPTDDAQVGEVFFAPGAKSSSTDGRIVLEGIEDDKKPDSRNSPSGITGLSNGDRIAFHADIVRVPMKGSTVPGVVQHEP